MNTIARLILVAVLALGSGCAKPDWIEQTLVTADVTGTWQSIQGGMLRLVLEQQGTKVLGTVYLTASSSSGGGRIEGTMAGDTFRFKQVTGAIIVGEMKVSGDEMSGSVQGPALPSRGQVHLERVDSSRPPRSQ